MTEIIYSPFTYLIGWSSLNKWYYGVRFARNTNPKELWSKYFTSSKSVKEYRKNYGEPDIIQVRQTFNDSFQARLWEEKVIRRLGIVENDKWLNQSNCGKKFYCNGHSEKTRKKLSNSLKGRKAPNKGIPASEETKRKLSESHKGQVPYNKGIPCSEETKRKISESQKGRVSNRKGVKCTPEQCQRNADAQRGKKLSEEHRKNIGKGNLGKKRGPYKKKSK